MKGENANPPIHKNETLHVNTSKIAISGIHKMTKGYSQQYPNVTARNFGELGKKETHRKKSFLNKLQLGSGEFMSSNGGTDELMDAQNILPTFSAPHK